MKISLILLLRPLGNGKGSSSSSSAATSGIRAPPVTRAPPPPAPSITRAPPAPAPSRPAMSSKFHSNSSINSRSFI